MKHGHWSNSLQTELECIEAGPMADETLASAASKVTVPTTFSDAFDGIRAKLVKKMNPTELLNRLQDKRIITNGQRESIEVGLIMNCCRGYLNASLVA